METEYGLVKYLYEMPGLYNIYIYDIKNGVVRSGVMEHKPHLSLLRVDHLGRHYFLKQNKRVYLEDLEELEAW